MRRGRAGMFRQVAAVSAVALLIAMVAATAAQASPRAALRARSNRPRVAGRLTLGSQDVPPGLRQAVEKKLGPQVSGSYTQTAKLDASDGAQFDEFGDSVALSSDGTTALVGAYEHNSATGAAYVFALSGGSWSQTAELTASDGASGDWFGYTVALSGDGTTALVGALYHGSTGAAYVFALSGGSWSQTAELTASDGASGDEFGYSVAISSDGTTALVGAYGHNSFTGAAYVFTQSGGSWSQTAELDASDGQEDDGFGDSVALSSDGTTALVGADGHSFGTGAGAAYVFTQSGGSWSQATELTASGEASGDGFGISVALSSDGTTALVGADGHNSHTGAAYVFTQSAGSWSQATELTASDGGSGDYFGLSVALSSDGATAIVGAYGHSSFAGAAYVFTQSGGSWSQTAELNGGSGDSFGISVALSSDGTTALVGADGQNTFTGAAYVFTQETQTPTTTSLLSSDNPSVVGEQVTYTAGVSPVPDGGMVAFSDGGTPISGCDAVPVDTTTGQATCPVTYSGVGSHQITAAYLGDTNFEGSNSSPLTQQVNQAQTTTTVSASGTTFGQPTTLTATVGVNPPGSGTPTGRVSFYDGGVLLGSASLNGQSPDEAEVQESLPVGQAQVTASYAGDQNFEASSSAPQAVEVGCTTEITHRVFGGVVVTSSESVCIQGVRVNGGVFVHQGGSLAVLPGSSINGVISSNGAAGLEVCGATVRALTTVSATTGQLLLGDDGTGLPPGCGPDRFLGALILSGNSGGLELSRASVRGLVTLGDNSAAQAPPGQAAPIQVSANSIRGGLACTGNDPAPSNAGMPNSVRGAEAGQCAGL